MDQEYEDNPDFRFMYSGSAARPNMKAFQRMQARRERQVPHKRIILCLDGTDNTPKDQTNVRRIWQCLLGTQVDGSIEDPAQRVAENPLGETPDQYQINWPDEFVQVSFYQPGISGLKQKLLGDEVHEKIKEAYKFLCDHWERDGVNEIVLIGFSRGGFACQTLAIFIAMYGVMDLEVVEDWKYFTSIYDGWLRSQERAFPHGFQKDPQLGYNTVNGARMQPVKACALFDSVAGMDTRLYRWFGSFLRARGEHLTFSHHHLPGNVQSVYHALSLNEHRESFRPVLWANPLDRQELVQTWFPGFHSDIGGHVDNLKGCNIQDLTLIWMASHLKDKVKIHIGELRELCRQRTTRLKHFNDSKTLLYQLDGSEERFQHLTKLAQSLPLAKQYRPPATEPTIQEYAAYIPGLTKDTWATAVTRASETPEKFHWSVIEYRRLIEEKTGSKAFKELQRFSSGNRWYWNASSRNQKVYEEESMNTLENMLGVRAR